jgi:hypothetical protein
MGVSIDLTGGFQHGLLTMALPVLAAAGLMTAIHRYSEGRARALVATLALASAAAESAS